MASSAVPATAAISNAESLSIMRDRTAQATIESSTIISRIRRRVGRGAWWRSRDLASARSTSTNSGDADELQFDVKCFPVEGLHHILIRTGFKRRADMRHVVFCGAKHDLGLVGMAALTEELQKLHPAHHRHVPVEQDDVRHLGLTARQRFLPVARFLDFKF